MTRPNGAPSQPASAPVPVPGPRPPTFESYRPGRTTAESGVTMLVSGIFAGGAMVVLALAVYSKVFDSRAFGQISNLIMFAVALLLLAVYILVWEIAIRLTSRSPE